MLRRDSSSARSSAISGALNVISFMRAMISRAVVGTLRAFARIDLHDQHVVGRVRLQERQQRGIAAVAAVPIGHAVDLDRAEQERQAGRRHHDLGA